MQTFINLPEKISETLLVILSKPENSDWVKEAKQLHTRYMAREKGHLISKFTHVLGYLGLRIPATYAQITSALFQIQQVIPSFKPTALLDIGSGPGTAVWATKTVFPSLQKATCIDRERYFLSVGKEILEKSELAAEVVWKEQDITSTLTETQNYDVVIIANVLNELDQKQRNKLLGQAFNLCSGVLVIIEPGTEFGFDIIQSVAKNFSEKTILVAPYINNSFVQSNTTWIHFSQRFIRPDFLRRLRQSMRDSFLMASDWEESKFTYVAISKIPVEKTFWGRTIGSVKKTKAYIEVPILTETGISQTQVLKRKKTQFNLAKKLRWGEIIKESII